MSHTPLNRQSQHGNVVIFSFGQEENKPFQSSLSFYSNKEIGDSKLDFIFQMIQKYESKQVVLNKVAPTIDSVKIYQQIQQHADSNKNHNYLSTNRHKQNFSPNEETKDEQSILSRLKSELQQSHQQLLDKYLTPIRRLDHCNQNIPQHDCVLFGNNICEFLNSSIKEENQSEKVNQQSIPMVESLIMTDQQMNITENQLQIQKQFVIRSQKLRSFEQNEPKEDLKVSHVLLLCIIILGFLVWKI